MVDFTAPDAVEANVRAALEQGVPCVVGTSGWDPAPLGALAAERGLPLLVVPNFALGAVLMMRLAAEAARYLPRAEIVELHGEGKKDAPSGTAKATAERARRRADALGAAARAWSPTRRCCFGGEGQLLTIRHDAFSREAYVPGVLLALERLRRAAAGVDARPREHPRARLTLVTPTSSCKSSQICAIVVRR